MKALVFSAGGSFGAYEAGVWQGLEERGFRPQIVVGTSAGSINAAAVAHGAPAKLLEEWWRDPASNVFRPAWPPRSLGAFDPRFLEKRLEDFFQAFPQVQDGIQLFVTVTELPSTKIRVLSGDQVTVKAIVASSAVPGAFPPVALAGRRYMDGGLFARLPLRVAADAGATEIVSVDLLATLPSLVLRGLRAVARVRHLWIREPDLSSLPPGIRQCPIDPREPLGAVLDMMRWERGKIDRWIELGYRDALAARCLD